MEFLVENSQEGLMQVLFPIKFEIEQSFIDFSTIERTAYGIRDVYRGSEVILFGYSHGIELVYGAAEAGSVTTWVGKKAIQGASLVALYAGSQFTDGFLEQATGRTFRDWGAEAAVQLAKVPHHVLAVKDDIVDILAAKLAEAELCRRFLEMDEDEFESLASEKPEAAIHIQNGRRKFFEACRANEQLPGVRFGSTSSTRQVFRTDFSKRTKRSTIAQSSLPQAQAGDWIIEVLEIEVTSPNWERLDQQRGWKGKLANSKYIYFQITDSRFWTKISDGSLLAKAPDKLTAQVIYQSVGGRYKNAEALKVLTFNDEYVSKELAKDEIQTILDSNNAASKQSQVKLFVEDDD